MGQRYGKNLHEFRDTAISYLHTKAASKGLDMDCVHFFAGHFGHLDKNQYDKFYNDKAFTLEMYKVAEPHLNLVSNPNGVTVSKLEEQEQKVAELERILNDPNELLNRWSKRHRERVAELWAKQRNAPVAGKSRAKPTQEPKKLDFKKIIEGKE